MLAFLSWEKRYFGCRTVSEEMKNGGNSHFCFDLIIAVYEKWASGRDTHSIWLQHQDRPLLIGIPNGILRIFCVHWRQHSTQYCTHMRIWWIGLICDWC